MPELGYPQNDFIKAVKCEAGKLGYADTQLIYGALRLRGEHRRELDEMIGAGAEYVVVPGPQGKGESIALAFKYKDKDMSPRRAKSIFYLQRIFSTIFPHNFPHFYAAFGRPQAGTEKQTAAPTGQIRERIKGLRHGLGGYYAEGDYGSPFRGSPDPRVKYPFENVLETCEEFRFHLHYDNTSSNFLIGSDGGEYYVDVVEPAFSNGLFRPDVTDRISQYMKQNNYNDKEIYIVQKSIERLRNLSSSTSS